MIAVPPVKGEGKSMVQPVEAAQCCIDITSSKAYKAGAAAKAHDAAARIQNPTHSA